MRVYKVTPCKDCDPCIEQSLEAVMSWIEEASDDAKIVVIPTEMSEAELDDLPDYMGP